MNALRIISDPIAAAIAYALNRKVGEERDILTRSAVGGAFDAKRLAVREIFEMQAAAADMHMGGKHFNLCVVDFCL